MKVEFHKTFLKRIKKRFENDPSFEARFKERTRLFEANPSNPILHNHPLKGDHAGYWSFSVRGDVRVIYFVYEGIAYFVDIGSHNQVY